MVEENDLTMRYSVIIPLYNKAPYILQTLQSVVDQTEWPDEIVVVDDKSTDGGADLAATFFREAPAEFRRSVQTKLIRNVVNSGIGVTRNTGLDNSTGDVVTFLDGDDLYDPHFIARMKELFETHGADMVLFRVKLFPSGIAYPNFAAVERFHRRVTDHAYHMREPLKVATSHQYVFGIGSNVVIRRTWMETERFSETARFYEGIDCWYRQIRQIATANGTIFHLQGNYLRVREIEGSASRSKFTHWSQPVFPPLLDHLEKSTCAHDRNMRGLMRGRWIVHSLNNLASTGQKLRFIWHFRNDFLKQGMYGIRRAPHFLLKGMD